MQRNNGDKTPVVRSPPNVLVMTLLVAASVPSDKVCITSGENEVATAKHLNLGCNLYIEMKRSFVDHQVSRC